MRGDGVGKRVAGVPMVGDGAVGKPRPDVGNSLAHDLGFCLGIAGTQRGAENAQAISQHRAQVDLFFRATLHANDHQLAVFGQRFQVLFQVFRADDVQNDVAGAFQLVDEILFFVVDQDIRAVFLAGFQLFRRACGDGDFRAQFFRDLNGEGADAATAAVNQDGLAITRLDQTVQATSTTEAVSSRE